MEQGSVTTPSTPTASDTGAEKKTKRSRGPAGLNQHQLDELTFSEQVALVAQKKEHAETLALREISADEVMQLRLEIGTVGKNAPARSTVTPAKSQRRSAKNTPSASSLQRCAKRRPPPNRNMRGRIGSP